MKLHLKTDSPYLVPRYDFWPALIGAAVSLGSAIYGAYSTNKANKQNKEYADKANAFTREQYEYDKAFTREQYEYDKAFTREQYDYNKQLNSVILDREDNAYQRAVADARSAGLSPLTVAGSGGAGAGGTVSQSNLSNGTYSTGSYGLQTPNVQAPQIEANTFASMMNSLEQQSMQDRQIDAQSKSQDKQISFESMKLQTQLDAQNEMLDKQLESSSLSQDKELSDRQAARVLQSKQFNAQLNFLIDSKNSDYIHEMQKDAVHSAAEMGIKKFYYVDSQEALKAGYDSFTQAYLDAGDRAMKNYYSQHGLGADSVTETTGATDSSSAGLSASAGSGSGSGVGSAASLGASDSTSDSVVKSSSVYDQMRSAQVSAGNRAGFPILVNKVHRRDD